jgi:drug/metabolite transporter (DMT)-like permease
MVTATSVLWGVNGPVSRLVLDAGVGPTTLAAVRMAGSAALVVAVVATTRPTALRVGRSALVRLGVFGLVGIALAQWAYFEAISRFDVGLALVIIYTAPLWVAAYQRIVGAEMLTPRVATAMLAAVAGVALAVLGGGDLASLSALGFGAAALAALAYAAQLLLAAKLPGEVPALPRIGLAMAAGTAFWSVAHPWWQSLHDVGDAASLGPRLGGSAPIGVLLLGIVALGTVAPYGLFVAGVRHIGPTAAGVTGMVEPVVGGALGWALLGQALAPLQVAGMALALGAVVVAERARSRAR